MRLLTPAKSIPIATPCHISYCCYSSVIQRQKSLIRIPCARSKSDDGSRSSRWMTSTHRRRHQCHRKPCRPYDRPRGPSRSRAQSCRWRPCRPWKQSRAVLGSRVSQRSVTVHCKEVGKSKIYLFLGIHAGEATAVAGLTTLRGDSLNLFLGAGEMNHVSKVSWQCG